MSEMKAMGSEEVIKRVVIEGVTPEIDGGRFPIKRSVGEQVVVEADIFADGHDELTSILLHRRDGEVEWHELSMEALGNDRWRGAFTVSEMGRYFYTLQAWVDRFKTWQRDLRTRVKAGQEMELELLVGAGLVAEAGGRASVADRRQLEAYATTLGSGSDMEERLAIALSEELALLVGKYPDTSCATSYGKELAVTVDREKARFSAWYEMFPRSWAPEPGRHGTFKDCEARLPYIAGMGFDVLYLPPIHPVGRIQRRGKNNSAMSEKGDVGSPWAIGAEEGGHKATHPQLGTLAEFRHLVGKAREHGIEVALDIAFQCAPDHPYVKEHPEWFLRLPNGDIRYAENPPKKYQDIYPLNFDSDRWPELWEELKSIVLFWIEQGVRIFRVDNPHTKPFAFWEWLIAEVRASYPDVLFLSEAFTRPRVMYNLAKRGFNQSYTYFAWRNTKWELTQYFTELIQTEVREFFRPSLWTNTPDILTGYLQAGGRPAFMARLVLAATLGASYGIYGPAFELCENRPKEPGSEEYLDSEKYEIKRWELEALQSLKDFIAGVNRIRRENPALQTDWTLRFHHLDNEQMLCYSKSSQDLSNVIIVVVNLDPHHAQSGWVSLALEELGVTDQEPFQVHDLLSDARYLWQGPRNYVELNPTVSPAHIFRVRHRVRTERDFDYYG